METLHRSLPYTNGDLGDWQEPKPLPPLCTLVGLIKQAQAGRFKGEQKPFDVPIAQQESWHCGGVVGGGGDGDGFPESLGGLELPLCVNTGSVLQSSNGTIQQRGGGCRPP